MPVGTFPTSPDTENGYIGTGIMYFSEDDGVTYRDLGEGDLFSVTPAVETKEQVSSRGGVKSTWIKRVTKISSQIKVRLLEITPQNFQYFALGDIDTDSDGNLAISQLTNSQIVGLFRFIGDNDTGQRIKFDATVQFIPAGAFSPIDQGDDFQAIELTADVQKGDDGGYGKWTFLGVGGTWEE